MSMTLGSLFDGAGGFPYAGTLAGITPLWASEIEPFPIRVTKKRFPKMKHLGNITAINGAEIPPVDIITFGSPCQDLSVANGNRKGLDGERSGLFREAVRIIKEMREATHGAAPTFTVWENVPGAFSSNGGDDFRTVIEEIIKIKDPGNSIPKDYKWEAAGIVELDEDFSIAWRVYDAQYWGVPQRRCRIYLVADFRGTRAGKIQFERESLYRDAPQSGQRREDTADDTRNRVDTASGGECGESRGTDATGGGIAVDSGSGGGVRGDGNEDDGKRLTAISGQSADARGIGYSETVSPTLKSEAGGNTVPCVVTSGTDYLTPWDAQSKRIFTEKGVSPTLDGADGGGGRNPGGLIFTAGFNGHKSVTGNVCFNEERSPCIETKMPPNVVQAEKQE
jgi:DNA (cytosine-5)-methyltransferase 1